MPREGLWGTCWVTYWHQLNCFVVAWGAFSQELPGELQEELQQWQGGKAANVAPLCSMRTSVCGSLLHGDQMTLTSSCRPSSILRARLRAGCGSLHMEWLCSPHCDGCVDCVAKLSHTLTHPPSRYACNTGCSAGFSTDQLFGWGPSLASKRIAKFAACSPHTPRPWAAFGNKRS